MGLPMGRGGIQQTVWWYVWTWRKEKGSFDIGPHLSNLVECRHLVNVPGDQHNTVSAAKQNIGKGFDTQGHVTHFLFGTCEVALDAASSVAASRFLTFKVPFNDLQCRVGFQGRLISRALAGLDCGREVFYSAKTPTIGKIVLKGGGQPSKIKPVGGLVIRVSMGCLTECVKEVEAVDINIVNQNSPPKEKAPNWSPFVTALP